MTNESQILGRRFEQNTVVCQKQKSGRGCLDGCLEVLLVRSQETQAKGETKVNRKGNMGKMSFYVPAAIRLGGLSSNASAQTSYRL